MSNNSTLVAKLIGVCTRKLIICSLDSLKHNTILNECTFKQLLCTMCYFVLQAYAIANCIRKMYVF